MIMWSVADLFPTRVPCWPWMAVVVVDGPPEIDAQGILFVGKLFGEIPRVTPEGEV